MRHISPPQMILLRAQKGKGWYRKNDLKEHSLMTALPRIAIDIVLPFALERLTDRLRDIGISVVGGAILLVLVTHSGAGPLHQWVLWVRDHWEDVVASLIAILAWGKLAIHWHKNRQKKKQQQNDEE